MLKAEKRSFKPGKKYFETALVSGKWHDSAEDVTQQLQI
jgi:hypothetical protein